MVRNTQGGNYHKKQASKHIQENKAPSRLRKAELDGEVYAIVTKMVGGALCNILGVDNIPRSCVIRGKFRGGGGKRNNFIKTGTLVLIGDRTWLSSSSSNSKPEVTPNKQIVCDLLEVYSDIEKEQLRLQCPHVHWSVFNTVDTITGTSKFDDNIHFDENATLDDNFNNTNTHRDKDKDKEKVDALVGYDCGDGEDFLIDVDAI